MSASYLKHSSLPDPHSQQDEAEEQWNVSSGGFDCNICLSSVHDPVVTICGHLYCWPCIYQWIHHHHPRCPVCKSHISKTSLVPLYGRGQSDEKDEDSGPMIPQRPKGPSSYEMATSAMAGQSDYGYVSAPDVSTGNSMAFAVLFGRLDTCRDSYGVVFSRSARARRNMMRADRSLRRLSLFMWCCLFLCLVLF